MNPVRLQGLGFFSLAAATWYNFTALTLMMGTTLPTLAMIGSTYMVMSRFNERNHVSQIKSLHNGDVLITVQDSILVSRTITTNPRHVFSMCSLGADDVGADDTEANAIIVMEYTNSNGDHITEPAVFIIPADAVRDRQFMEWLYAKKHPRETLTDDFNDLMRLRHEERRDHGGIPWYKMNLKYADSEYIEGNMEAAILKKLVDQYGEKYLNSISARELYNLY